jgi:hypothetical protein
MKRTRWIITVAAAVSLLGCQKDGIVFPADDSWSGHSTHTAETPHSADKGVSHTSLLNEGSDLVPIDFIVPLRGTLRIPGQGLLEIDGQLGLRIEEILPEMDWTQFACFTVVTATLRPFGSDQPVWGVEDRSYDEILFEGNGRLYKSYIVQGRTDRLILNVCLLITSTKVVLDGMWLDFPPVPVLAPATAE